MGYKECHGPNIMNELSLRELNGMLVNRGVEDVVSHLVPGGFTKNGNYMQS